MIEPEIKQAEIFEEIGYSYYDIAQLYEQPGSHKSMAELDPDHPLAQQFEEEYLDEHPHFVVTNFDEVYNGIKEATEEALKDVPTVGSKEDRYTLKVKLIKWLDRQKEWEIKIVSPRKLSGLITRMRGCKADKKGNILTVRATVDYIVRGYGGNEPIFTDNTISKYVDNPRRLYPRLTKPYVVERVGETKQSTKSKKPEMIGPEKGTKVFVVSCLGKTPKMFESEIISNGTARANGRWISTEYFRWDPRHKNGYREYNGKEGSFRRWYKCDDFDIVERMGRKNQFVSLIDGKTIWAKKKDQIIKII